MEPSPARLADLFSSLPEEHQDEILRRLPLRDAVRTSALSRGWRRRWESVPRLALVFPDGTPPGVVDRVLLCHTGRGVSRFAFQVVDDASASHAGHWLLALSRRGVLSIDLRSCPPNRLTPHTLHSSIFSCTRLVSLHLEHFCLPPLPVGFAGFPVLEDLYLREIKLPDDRDGQLQAIIHGSPLLRVLYLEHEQYPQGGCVIQAPNLRSLTLNIPWNDGWRFGELPCLHDACICVDGYDEEDEQDFGELLAQLAQVEELTLQSPFCDKWYTEVKIDMTPFTFYNLKSLELSTLFNNMNQMLVMFCLLKSSPNLERLKVESRDYGDVNWKLLSAQWTNGMCSNLQDVQITGFDDVLPMPFIKLILSKASRLRTLSVEAGCFRTGGDQLIELLACTRASPHSQVMVKDAIESIRFHRDVAYDSSEKQSGNDSPGPC
ncbi:unnamed protein product [Urochloa decumbens]|uniref:F-box domain-containing protein n=1 Tax=Urochloa decumbens TaxID=240449 RepID=A0ABC9H1G8_9POAL